MTRSTFILRGALAASGVYGAGAVAPFVARALAREEPSDLEAVGLALALERLQAAFYAAALGTGRLSGEVKALATELGRHETVHVETLGAIVERLGGSAEPPAAASFRLRSQDEFLTAAVALEDVAVGAYNGLVPRLTAPEIVEAAGSIVAVEARHAAALRFRGGEDPAPSAFDPALGPARVRATVRRLSGG